MSPPASQHRAPEFSGLYDITVKWWLHAHVSNHAPIHPHAEDTDSKAINTPTMCRFFYLCIFGSCSMYCSSACRRILVVVRTCTLPISPTCPHSYNLGSHSANLAISHAQFVELSHNAHSRPFQRSRRNLKRSSKAPLMHASNCPEKAIAPTMRVEQSGSGMYQESST